MTVNGARPPPADRLHPVIDVGAPGRRGENTLEAGVATPLQPNPA
ncbi:hypothetical protein [Streptomyces sp. NPDC051636]